MLDDLKKECFHFQAKEAAPQPWKHKNTFVFCVFGYAFLIFKSMDLRAQNQSVIRCLNDNINPIFNTLLFLF